jgi:hypothetical protein
MSKSGESKLAKVIDMAMLVFILGVLIGASVWAVVHFWPE